MIPELKPKIGFVLFGAERFQKLGEGTARGTYSERKEKEAAAYIAGLSGCCEVVPFGPVYSRESADEAVRKMYDSGVDCVVATFVSWAEDFAWIRFLRGLHPVPLMLASFVRDELDITDTNDEDQFVDFLSAGSLVGFQEASGSLRRFARPMSSSAIGTMDELCPRITRFARASRVRSVLRRSKIGLLSSYNEAMWATYIDPYNMFMKVGPELCFLSVADMEYETEKISDEQVEAIVKDLESRYEKYPNVDGEKFRASVRGTLAMENLAHANGVDVLSLNDCDAALFRHIGLRPGFAPTDREDRVVYIPEGDLGAALAVYILSLTAGQNANFIEPFYIDHKRNVIVSGHAGPNYYHGAGKTVIARDERFAKSGWKHAGAPFAWYVFPAGPKTVLHVSECGGRIKMAAFMMNALPTEHYLASYSHADFAPLSGKAEDLFEELGKIGVTQHYAIVDGNWIGDLRSVAAVCDFDFYEVGENNG